MLPVRMHGVAAIAMALLAIAGCAARAAKDPGEPPLARADGPLDRLRQRQAEAISLGDLSLFLDGLTDDAVLMFPDQPAVVGRPAIAASLRPLFDLYRLDASALSVDSEHAGDWGFDRGTLEVRARPVTGGKSLTRTTRYLLVARSGGHGGEGGGGAEGDGWRISQLAFNSPARAGETGKDRQGVAPEVASSEAADDASADPAVRGVHEALASLMAADNAGDARAVAEHYTEDAMLLPPGHAFVKGRSAIRAHYEDTFERFQFIVDIDPVATWAGAEWATSRGTTKGSNVDRKNGKTHPFEHQYLMILQRDGETWKVHRILWSPRGIR